MEQNNPYKQEVKFMQVLQRPIKPGDDVFSQSLSALGVPHQGLLVTTVGTTNGDYNDGTNQYFIDWGKDSFFDRDKNGKFTQIVPWEDVENKDNYRVVSLYTTNPNTTVKDIFESAGSDTLYNLFTANCIQSYSRAIGTSGKPLIPNARKYNENPYFDERPPIRSASYMDGSYDTDKGYKDNSKDYKLK
ncbi:hypothetical protein RclHR1_02400008 [Rhizophagus clarus]|uniref:Uncharacterized protein n=1 Tax=Rhizophagus clarus TaxID=94130 RepID=A0A2Z6R1M0_9GLOM|nr:hypothetical protein RclHR1_02400008 [Rhizophagus clarus]GES82547.1 hypothetical protein GLOIN_2v1787384 [Rhizophagus clarus]